ncbi:MAG: hypothetical protein WD231_00655 [Candidatus Woykebacteria bacterium]
MDETLGPTPEDMGLHSEKPMAVNLPDEGLQIPKKEKSIDHTVKEGLAKQSKLFVEDVMGTDASGNLVEREMSKETMGRLLRELELALVPGSTAVTNEIHQMFNNEDFGKTGTILKEFIEAARSRISQG